MPENKLYIPFLNPVKFYKVDRANISTFFTKHFDDFTFEERNAQLQWNDQVSFKQIWQTTDIIKLQFESEFDPLIVELVDVHGVSVITLPALIGLQNQYFPTTFSFEVSMSLAGLDTGCYYLKVTGGTGDEQEVYESRYMYISSEQIENSLLVEYWHNRFHQDVIFETGIKFQYRVPGHFGRLTPGRLVEKYKDQRQSPALLSSQAYRKFDLVFGDEFGLPDDEIDLLNRICGCHNINIDNKLWAVDEKDEFEFIDIDNHPKRGVKLIVAEGINRYSSVFTQTTDAGKKLTYAIMVEGKVWGDLSNQGSSNTVPIFTIE